MLGIGVFLVVDASTVSAPKQARGENGSLTLERK